MDQDPTVSIVEGANLIVLDRLRQRTHWVNPADHYECHTCLQFFHFQAKHHCHLCGHVVCDECIEQLVVTGDSFDSAGQIVQATVSASACLACFHHVFERDIIGFVGGHWELEVTKPAPQRRHVHIATPIRMAPTMPPINQRVVTRLHAPPEVKVAKPILKPLKKPTTNRWPFSMSKLLRKELY
ncbi:Aste57867_5917 [Aphanomyces stellatus]|uniref:Aste57867_5917 protein n=1 Tax=Aphanomyces stellatus TaxID=120398 RepID=A0A485KEW2_9STRA|nr:hypothetical protein As57867_005903 [Aphanomyces stellatus]VFT82938.1 Aste57867_5917 [Aphanomyces stellatus]